MRAFWVWQLQWACCIFEIYDSVWFFGFIILESQIYVYRMDFADRTGRNRSFGKYRILSNLFGFIWRMEFSEVNFYIDTGGIVIIGTEYLAGVVKIRKQDIFSRRDRMV